jgi:hypothetical protein
MFAGFPVETCDSFFNPTCNQNRVALLLCEINHPLRGGLPFQFAISHKPQTGRSPLHAPIRLGILGQFVKG